MDTYNPWLASFFLAVLAAAASLYVRYKDVPSLPNEQIFFVIAAHYVIWLVLIRAGFYIYSEYKSVPSANPSFPKCPHCGYSEFVLGSRCPECGYQRSTHQKENITPMNTQPAHSAAESKQSLTAYLVQTENRIAELERENRQLELYVKQVEGRIPKTDLVSHSFWRRATAVFGYNWLVGLVITLALILFSVIVSL